MGLNAAGRVDGWECRLQTVLDGAVAPFDWRTQNCAFFAGDAIEALTGVDPIAGFRCKVTGIKSARRQVRDFAGGLEATADRIAAEFGFAEWPSPLYAQRGDVVLIRQGSVAQTVGRGFDCALGVCTGPSALFAGSGGPVETTLGDCARAWSIRLCRR